MTKEREEYLVKTFPKIYTNCGENNCYTLFGIECGDGWFRIIYWLSKYIQNRIDQNNHWAEKYPDQTKPMAQVKVIQVKEKFGSLRFYFSGGDEEISATVDFVEYISAFICETTGKNENIGRNSKGWITTHHESLAHEKDFHFVDSEELRALNLNNKN